MSSGPVYVYPTSVDVTPSEPDESRSADTGEAFERGQLVRWFYTTDRPLPACAYCADGRCEQMVQSSQAWRRDVVVHDRPRAVN